ncbi:ABC transporter substrate-binding protein [Terasakiella brassicae]|nr:ABC transporter substrate-binding protein [Terasakiella brassicae]
MLCGAQAVAQGVFRVAFINPGAMDDPFFSSLTYMMQDAASDLNIDLEVIDASASHLEVRRRGHEVLERSNPPDYLLLINDHDVLDSVIKRADMLGVKTFLFNEGFSSGRLQEMGTPRHEIKNWLGQFLPDDRKAGYLLARDLIEHAKGETSHGATDTIDMIALNGAYRANSSELRLLGLQDALAEYDNVKLRQIVYTHWDEKKAYDATRGLLERYPETSVIWSASDLMACGALHAVKEYGLKPEQDILIGGIDWSDLALEAIRKGDLQASVGWHVMDGAWSLILLYDYHNGYDFTVSGHSDYFVMNKENIERFDRYLGSKEKRGNIDFKAFTKTHRLQDQPYDFSLEVVLRHLSEFPVLSKVTSH